MVSGAGGSAFRGQLGGEREVIQLLGFQELGQVDDNTVEPRVLRAASGLLSTGFRGIP